MSRLKLLSVKELSEEIGIPVSSIYKLIESEMIPFLRIRKGKNSKVYFRVNQIEEWLKDHEKPARFEIPQVFIRQGVASDRKK